MAVIGLLTPAKKHCCVSRSTEEIEIAAIGKRSTPARHSIHLKSGAWADLRTGRLSQFQMSVERWVCEAAVDALPDASPVHFRRVRNVCPIDALRDAFAKRRRRAAEARRRVRTPSMTPSVIVIGFTVL